MQLLARFHEYGAREALIWRDQAYSYAWLLARIDQCSTELDRAGVRPGCVVALEADFSPLAVAWLVTLMRRKVIVVPLTESAASKRDEFLETAQVEVVLGVDAHEAVRWTHTARRAEHALYTTLRQRQATGLVVFSSGSTGTSKATVHDLDRLMRKFDVARPPNRAIAFLLFDHWGGLNTLFHVLSNGGCLITVRERTPREVLAAIDRHHADLLPTSPTFINLILLSEAYREFNLASLRTVSYGTEPMPESTLRRFHQLFPSVSLRQTYGLTELGVMRAQSRSPDSLWVRIGGEGYQTRVVDGILHVKAESAMLGYLNAPAPFTDDGWFVTGDRVEVDGDYLRILGRVSELINVGGEKVFPAQVEDVILELPEVAEVTVYGHPNAVTGMAVCARVRPSGTIEAQQLSTLVIRHCRSRLERYMVPVRVVVDDAPQMGSRLKKRRRVPRRNALEEEHGA
jgi:acyl-CoA synthetase (AMP-forming)/AMP-acid ligase II